VALTPAALTAVPTDAENTIILFPTPTPTEESTRPSIVVMPTSTISQITPSASTGEVITVTMMPTEIPTATVAASQKPIVPVTPTLATALIPAVIPSDRAPFVDPTTLVAMLSTMLLSLTLFVTATLRVLPRKILVHHALWAINAGLVAYIFYGFELIPGTENLRQYLNIWTGAIIVLVAMLITLLWLQSRAQE